MWIWKSDLIKWEEEMMKQLPKEKDSTPYYYLKGKLFVINRLINKKSPIT